MNCNLTPPMSRDPLSQTPRHAQTIAELCRYIENAEHSPTLEELAQRAGMSVYHLHRVFKAISGLTHKGYATAQRSQRVRRELASGGSVTEAIYEAGYNSGSRFYEKADQVLGMTPSRFRAGGAQSDIRFAIGQCSLGAIL